MYTHPIGWCRLESSVITVVPIYDRNRHKLCSHNSRNEEIDCCEEFCMERLRVKKVFNQIRLNL